MKNIASKLNLSADASEESILAVVDKLLNRGDITSAELKTLREEHAAFKTGNETLLSEQVDALFAAHGVTDDKVRNRLKPIIVSCKNREERTVALTELGFKQLEAKDEKSAARIINRSETSARQEVQTGDEEQLAKKAEAEVRDYKIRNRCTYAEARNAVRISKPELFGLSKQ